VGSKVPNDVVLEYELSLFDTEFMIAYTVTNGTAASIWLTTPLTQTTAEGRVVADPQKVYAYVDPDGVLHVTKRMWPVPEDVDVYAPERPMLTELPAGAVFAETLRLPVPVPVGVPYTWTGPMRKRGTRVMEIESLRFSYSIDVISGPSWGDADAMPMRLRGEEAEVVVPVVEQGV
jgi:hypothetical protein